MNNEKFIAIINITDNYKFFATTRNKISTSFINTETVKSFTIILYL